VCWRASHKKILFSGANSPSSVVKHPFIMVPRASSNIMMICITGKRSIAFSHLLLLIIIVIIHVVSSTAFSKQPATTSLRMSTAANPTPSSSELHVTILGGGNVGSTLAQKLSQSNKFGSVKIAARDPTKTTSSIQEKGVSNVSVVAATPEAFSTSNVVILATPGLYEDDDIKSFVSSLGDMTDKSSSMLPIHSDHTQKGCK